VRPILARLRRDPHERVHLVDQFADGRNVTLQPLQPCSAFARFARGVTRGGSVRRARARELPNAVRKVVGHGGAEIRLERRAD
jgi:hypothetical protein